jgi:hypothetical protein
MNGFGVVDFFRGGVGVKKTPDGGFVVIISLSQLSDRLFRKDVFIPEPLSCSRMKASLITELAITVVASICLQAMTKAVSLGF